MRATFDGLTKMPMPMIAPATTTVVSQSPSSRRKPVPEFGSAAADAVDAFDDVGDVIARSSSAADRSRWRPSSDALLRSNATKCRGSSRQES